MTTKSAIFAIAVTLTVCLPALGYAQATTSGTAVLDTFPGQVIEPTISDATPQKWFRYDLRGGRSYCAEAGAVRFASEEAGGRDPVVFIYAGDATPVIVSSDDASAEPDSVCGSHW